jgi:DNA-binding transcriptional regulator PaaX
MTDEDLLQQIRGLLDEEQAMRTAHEVDQDRLDQLEATLDQCWDLLRQRRARREFGQDETLARPRPVGTVEDYLQ